MASKKVKCYRSSIRRMASTDKSCWGSRRNPMTAELLTATGADAEGTYVTAAVGKYDGGSVPFAAMSKSRS